jgi:hypothetical protein
MTAIALMADKLNQELQDRGIFSIGRNDCVEIVRNVIDHASEVEKQVKDLQTSEMGKPD